MDLDQDYIEYVGQTSLALLTISAAYFINPNNFLTYLAILPVTVLYGYTAYISREGFNTASMLSLVSLIFIPVNILTGFIAVFIPVSNILISLFSSGTGFKNYSNATLMPMIFTGLILGGIVFGAAQTQPDIRQSISDNIANLAEEQTSLILQETNILEIQQEASTQMIEKTSEGTILLTRSYVANNTDFDPQQQQELDSTFREASNEIPKRLVNRTEEQSDSLNVSERVGQATRNLVQANIGIVILMFSMIFYVLNPVISLFTGIFGWLFEKLGSKI